MSCQETVEADKLVGRLSVSALFVQKIVLKADVRVLLTFCSCQTTHIFLNTTMRRGQTCFRLFAKQKEID